MCLGCGYVQLDAPHYPLPLDPAYRDFYESRGWPAGRWLELGVPHDKTVVLGLVTTKTGRQETVEDSGATATGEHVGYLPGCCPSQQSSSMS